MKNILVYICMLILFGFTTQAQLLTVANNSASVAINDTQRNLYDDEPRSVSKRKIPSNVQEAFHQKFQNVKKIKWRIEAPDLYEADFINENKENVSAYFNPEGKLLEVSTLKDVEDINVSLLQQINSQLNNPEVADLVEVKDFTTNEVFYVVNILVNDDIVEHHLDTEGNLIDEEKPEEVRNTNSNI
jgi:hypothetical protein